MTKSATDTIGERMHHAGTKDAAAGFTASELAAALTVTDLATSEAWYCNVLGFTIDRRHERADKRIAVSLRAGQVRLLITQDDGTQGLDRIKGAGFSLQLTTTQDIDALAAQIQSRGGTLEAAPVTTPWGVRVFRIRDPDGFRFTVSSPSTT